MLSELVRQEVGEAASTICSGSGAQCLLGERADCVDKPCIDQFTIIIFPFLALFIGVLGAPISRLVRLPYTLFLLVIGILIGALGCGVDLGLLTVSLQQWVHLNPPTVFFFVFLAPLIFEAAFNTRWHVFKRLLVPVLTAAFVIVVLQVALIAFFQRKVIQTVGWSWWDALMFGAMLSATDPISVTATLKSLGASEFLNTLIEGESLVNDGSAFVLWEEFFKNAEDPNALSVGDIVGSVFKLSIGGAAMGVAFGLVALIILGFVYDEFEVETSLTVIVAFLGFWTAQAPSKLSGVICNVASGLVLSAFGRHLITPAVREPLQEFWELLSWVANTIVFVHAGVLLTAFIWSCSGDPHGALDYVYILVWYLYLQIIRMGLILIFKPLMSVNNKWYQWREAFVVGFSGLRGAVSLILALEVAGSEQIPKEVKSRVVLWTTGIVALSLLVNGFFIKPVIHRLKLDKAEKTREDFLHRARAVMVQRTLMILDSLCIESAFKSARWSYVAKSSLPHLWTSDKEHGDGYREAVEQLMDNIPASGRKSLEVVRNEQKQRIIHSQVTRRLSQEIHSMKTSPSMTPRISKFDPMSPVDAMSPAPIFDTPGIGLPRAPGSPEEQLYSFPVDQLQPFPSHVATLSLGPTAHGEGDMSFDGPFRRSIDADIARYQRHVKKGKTSRDKIYKEVADLHNRLISGESYELTNEDREVRRRLLTAVLSQVRAFSNTSLVEYSVLVTLEEDLQKALDANEEGEDYDIFSFLDHKGGHGNLAYRKYLSLIEGKTLRGQTSITTAVVVFGILTEVLKAEILHESPIVQLEAERLYEAAAALLNRLETLNSRAFEWVESQMAIYVTAKKQDDILEDLLASGIVDDQEFKVVHEELIEVRREHIRTRHSIFHRAKLPTPPKPRALLRIHALFASLSPSLMSDVVDRYGELVHLKGGQSLQADKGALVLVLQGAIRPLDDTVLPPPMVAHLKKKNTEIDMAVKDGHSPTVHDKDVPNASSSSGEAKEKANGEALDMKKTVSGFTPLASGATMHWCFPANNGFCGPLVTLHSHTKLDGDKCDVASDRTIDTKFCCCEIAGSATVFTLPVNQVKHLAKVSEDFRLEITRSLAREIVLESVKDQRPYSLSQLRESISGTIDVTTVVGRAYRVIERLPYMKVVRLHAGETSPLHLQGPGVLLNGTVRVSIVDSSGLVGAINLLHEELTGPALLPAGGLILQEVHKPDDPTSLQSGFDIEEGGQPLTSEAAVEASAAAAEILGAAEDRGLSDTSKDSDVLAHVLIEEIVDEEKTAESRRRRWRFTEDSAGTVDMNGRFGIFRHVELAPLLETKIE